MLAWLERRLWLWVHRKDRHVYTVHRELTMPEQVLLVFVTHDSRSTELTMDQVKTLIKETAK